MTAIYVKGLNEALKRAYPADKMRALTYRKNPLVAFLPSAALLTAIDNFCKETPVVGKMLKKALGKKALNNLRRLEGEHLVDWAKGILDQHYRIWVEIEAPGKVAEYDLECLFPEGGNPKLVNKFGLAKRLVRG